MACQRLRIIPVHLRWRASYRHLSLTSFLKRIEYDKVEGANRLDSYQIGPNPRCVPRRLSRHTAAHVPDIRISCAKSLGNVRYPQMAAKKACQGRAREPLPRYVARIVPLLLTKLHWTTRPSSNPYGDTLHIWTQQPRLAATHWPLSVARTAFAPCSVCVERLRREMEGSSHGGLRSGTWRRHLRTSQSRHFGTSRPPRLLAKRTRRNIFSPVDIRDYSHESTYCCLHPHRSLLHLLVRQKASTLLLPCRCCQSEWSSTDDTRGRWPRLPRLGGQVR